MLANSLRSVVLGTALMAAIVVPASAAPAVAEPARSGPANAMAARVTIPYDIIVPADKGNEWLGRQRGQFTFDDRFIKNIGFGTDWGAGHSLVTFKLFRSGGKPVVRAFWFDGNDKPTGFTVKGRGFYKAEVTLCKYRYRLRPKCDKQTLDRLGGS
jgi:hypothetical protein